MIDNRLSDENKDHIFHSTENLDTYIKNLDPNDHLSRVAIEYAVCNSKRELVEYLIKKLAQHGNDVSKEWAEIYQIDHLVMSKKMSLTESINQLTHMQCKSTEMSILRKIFQLYNYYDLKAFQMIEIMSDLIQEEIKLLETGYMKDSLQSRLDLAMQSVYIHLNQVKKSREYGQNLKEIAPTPIMKAIAYKNLGLTYMLENYEESIYYYEKAKSILEEENNKTVIYKIQDTINFIHCYWDFHHKASWLRKETPEEIQTYAFYLVKIGKVETALELLDSVSKKIINDFQHGYHFYYRGIVTNDEKYFYESVKYFNLSEDHFFRQFPLLKLKEMGIDTKLLSALSV